MRRVLLAERISDRSDERSESIEDQDRKLRERAEKEGVTVVGTAVDESVSGDVDMFDRKSLGPWLRDEGLEKWDELWVTTQDRLSRDDIHFMAFVFKALEWNKTVIVLDDPEFNKQMRTMEGRLILHAKALGPAKELERIKIRNQESHDRRRFTNRWPGGVPPFGYRPEKRYENGVTATYLVRDEDMCKVLHEIRRLIVEEGQTFAYVESWLIKKSILTARDRARVRRGKPVKARGGEVGTPEKWSASSLRKLLQDEALLGYKKHKGEVIYGMDGKPIIMADPIFTQDEWDSLQAALSKRKNTKIRRVNGTSPLYGVVFCGKCGNKAIHNVTHRNGKEYRYYRCGKFPYSERCPGTSVPAEMAERTAEVIFVEEFGNKRVTKRVWVPGSDNSKEIEQITKRIARLRKQDEEGDWDDDQDGYRQRMNAYKERKKELESQPVVKGGWVEEDQGMTYGQLWPTLDLDGKRKQLIESGYKVMVTQGKVTIASVVDDSPIKEIFMERSPVKKGRRWREKNTSE